jgi:hypothetical protein
MMNKKLNMTSCTVFLVFFILNSGNLDLFLSN